MHPSNYLKYATKAGEIMLKNGAETYRVEETIKRMLKNFGYTNFECFTTTTGIFTSIEDPHYGIMTLVKRIKNRNTNLEKVSLVNQLSRDFECKKIDISTIISTLEQIDKKQTYFTYQTILGSAFTCFGFTIMAKGDIFDSINAFFIGFIVYSIIIYISRYNFPNFIINIFSGLLTCLFALIIINLTTHKNFTYVMNGCIMPFVPGVLLTNAIRDIFEGDYSSGISRIAEAVTISIFLAIGVLLCLTIWQSVFGDVRI